MSESQEVKPVAKPLTLDERIANLKTQREQVKDQFTSSFFPVQRKYS